MRLAINPPLEVVGYYRSSLPGLKTWSVGDRLRVLRVIGNHEVQCHQNALATLRVLRGCDFIATDLESVVLAPLHYSETTGASAFDVVHKRENHRDELGGVKKSHARSVP